MTSRATARNRILAVGCLAALVLSACGGDDADTTTAGGEPDTTAAGTETTAAEPEPTEGAADTTAAPTETSAAGGETTAAAGDGEFTFALVLPDLSNPFIAGIRDGAQAAADELGVSFQVTGSDGSEDQVNAVQNYIGAGVDLIGIDAIDAPAISAAVEQANEAGIPVIMVQASTETGEIETFIAADNVEGGRLIGQSIVEFCEGIDPCKLGVVEGNLADQSGVDEDTGMREVVGGSPNIQIVGNAPTNYDPAEALNVATNLLTADPDINFIYAWWDVGALSALEAVRAVDREGEVGIAGFGGNCANLLELIAGSIYHETMFFPRAMGREFIESGLRVMAGEDLPDVTPAKIYGMTTPVATAMLAGEEEPPADNPDVLGNLEQAQEGCPS